MDLNAYVLAGDPTFLAASVRSYYAIVDRVVVLYDKDGLGWSGDPIPVDEALADLRRIDGEGKLEFVPFTSAHAGLSPLECETRARQMALDLASKSAKWVLQLDSDEVIPRLDIFLDRINRAEAASATGLDFPSRWIYARTDDGRVLERCTRWWRAAGGYPGPLAIRAGTNLRLARQCAGALFRVDFRRRNTDPWHPPDAVVHDTIPLSAGVLHLSWVRSLTELVAKAQTSVHRHDFDWDAEIAKWRFRQRHPWLATAVTPLRRRASRSWLRLTTLPLDPPPRELP